MPVRRGFFRVDVLTRSPDTDALKADERGLVQRVEHITLRNT
jgi:hypothetical protein